MYTIEFSFNDSSMGMNLRNFLIRRLNSSDSLRLAKNKAAFKRLLVKNGLPTPKTYHNIHDFTDLPLISIFPRQFVIKPSGGFGGKGIILLERKNGFFINPSGDEYAETDLVRHIRKILDGNFSGYAEGDTVIIEERIYCSPRLQFKELIGLPDVRIWCYDCKPVMAMLRYPTFKSKGKSNLAQGGIGISLDIKRGTPGAIHVKGKAEPIAPDSLGIPPDFAMPKWEEMKMIAKKASEISGLKISGVDIVLGPDDKILVLEINGRPGLEIQNINEKSLLEAIKRT